MKKVLFIILALLLINVCTPAASNNDYVVLQRKQQQTCNSCRGKQSRLSAPQTCMAGCRRERKRFAKPLTRFAQPRIPQKAGYYKTGMNLRYPRKAVCERPTQPSRFNRNHTISQAKKYSCNGITYYGSKNPCK